MTPGRRGIVVLAILALAAAGAASARDLGQWQDGPVKEWYAGLMQPDRPNVPCCGESDAYFCDEVHVREGKTFCNITDDRPDEPRSRHHVPMGTEIFIPDYKLKYDKGNPTGHAIVFLNINNETYCFVQGAGI